MARATVSELLERIEAMQDEIDGLRAHIDSQAAAPSVQYVRELKPLGPVSDPLDFVAMATEQGLAYAYSEPEWWGTNRYL